MRVGYRRLSGALPIGDTEPGTRGAWWEKRRALLKALELRGHEVNLLSRVSKNSPHVVPHLGANDLLMVEFGGSNKMFFGKDLLETYRIIDAHRGPVVYLCDDPDLNFPWKEMPQEDWSRWTFAANALDARSMMPRGARYLDMPFSGLQLSIPKPLEQVSWGLAYIGRPNGRTRAFKEIQAARAPVRIFGRPNEWKDFPSFTVADPPTQTHRAAFYAYERGCLAVADAKHKRLGWRTGRAYHAVLAGCPVVAEADHPALPWALRYAHATDLQGLNDALGGHSTRAIVLRDQVAAVHAEGAQVLAAFAALGL